MSTPTQAAPTQAAPPRSVAARVPPVSDQRATRRIKVFLPTELVVEDVAVRAHVLDVSPHGSKVHTAAAPACGSDATLRLDGASIPARVAWRDRGRIGLKFDTELTPDQVTRIALLDQ